MIISTFVFFYDSFNDDEEQLYSLEEDINIEEFYLEPPTDLLKNTVEAILSL